MKTIVIPDLHHRTRWIDGFLKKQEPYDEVVFLGDYFDDWKDDAFISTGTAQWLRESLKDSRRKHCVGNHDMPYLIHVWNPVYNCPGFTTEKDFAINAVLTQKDWDKLVPAVFTQGWLLSHAGFNYNLVAHPIKGIPTPQLLVEAATAELIEARNGLPQPYFLPGWRMAEPYIGGITWQDWNEEYIPIVGIPQIVGHTPGTFPRARRVTKDQTDYCIDTDCKVVMVITNGKVENVIVK